MSRTIQWIGSEMMIAPGEAGSELGTI